MHFELLLLWIAIAATLVACWGANRSWRRARARLAEVDELFAEVTQLQAQLETDCADSNRLLTEAKRITTGGVAR
jgi:hypothetical protein